MTNIKDIRRKNLRLLARSVGGIKPLAQKLGRLQSQISHLIGNNPVKNIGDKMAALIENTFNKPPGWLDREQNISPHQFSASMLKEVPLLSWKEIDEWLEKEKDMSLIKTRYFSSKGQDKTFALRIEKDDMATALGTSFTPGVVIIVDPIKSINHDTFVVIRTDKNTEPLFRQLMVENSIRYLKPLNPYYPRIKFTEEMRVLGVVQQAVIDVAV